MAKVHPSLSHFLVGFLLVLIVADVAYVRVESCGEWGKDVCSRTCDHCDSDCVSARDFLVHHTECRPANFPGYMICTCCRS
ncbi:hypothetical protein C5167_029207 [Papaver somniferum]|nr:hypothetical protein C5167_029207 [Papaver somniferum]